MNNEGSTRKSSNILVIPAEPDLSALHVVEEACNREEVSRGACCQVEIHIQPNTNSTSSVLYSRDCNGRRKGTGGDEFYIRYEEYLIDDVDDFGEVSLSQQSLRLQAVALIEDRGDGRYELDFCTTPMHPSLPQQCQHIDDTTLVCSLTVYIEYTNGIGSLPPPEKRDWPNGGYTHKKYQIISRSPPFSRPAIRKFRPPTPEILLSNFDQVLFFGDSTFCQFVRQRPNKKGKYYFRPNCRVVGDKVRVGLDSTVVDSLLEQLEESDVDGMLTSQNKSPKGKALIVGSCLWDMLNAMDELQGSLYQDHAEACRTYISELRKRYPEVIVVWKSPMACHIHWVDLKRVVEHDRATAALFGINRIRYMSASRSRYLYELQKKICQEFHVPFLDLYEATYLSADLLYPSDGRHYKPDLNRKMLGWFYAEQPNADSGEVTPKYFQQVSIE